MGDLSSATYHQTVEGDASTARCDAWRDEVQLSIIIQQCLIMQQLDGWPRRKLQPARSSLVPVARTEDGPDSRARLLGGDGARERRVDIVGVIGT